MGRVQSGPHALAVALSHAGEGACARSKSAHVRFVVGFYGPQMGEVCIISLPRLPQLRFHEMSQLAAQGREQLAATARENTAMSGAKCFPLSIIYPDETNREQFICHIAFQIAFGRNYDCTREFRLYRFTLVRWRL